MYILSTQPRYTSNTRLCNNIVLPPPLGAHIMRRIVSLPRCSYLLCLTSYSQVLIGLIYGALIVLYVYAYNKTNPPAPACQGPPGCGGSSIHFILYFLLSYLAT
jgi:hypothetical protein